jgi:TIR domain
VIVGGTDGLGKWSALNESLPGRIFISYRRQETAWPARELYDVLVKHFPAEEVFKDVDNIDPGDDFVERVAAAVGSCDVLLVLIGPQWLTISDENGHRRLDNPEDYVRLEIETALTRNIRVIPILVDEARIPRANELPATLAPLVRRNAVEINPITFDTKRLIATVRKTLEQEFARRQAEEQARREVEEQARREADEQARREADEQARREAEEQARRQAEEQAQRQAEEQSRRQAEEQAQRQAEEQAQREAEEQAQREAEEQAQRQAEEQAQRQAEEQAQRQAEEQAQREAEEQAQREAEEHAQRQAEEQAQRQAEEQARREAEEQAQREAEEQARRRAEEQDRARQQREAKDRARRLRKEEPRRDTQQLLLSLGQRAARRWWVVVLAVSVAIGGALLLIIYVRTPPIMGQLPADLRASCSPYADTAATCRLTDGSFVLYQLFGTDLEARKDVVNGNEPEPNCPTSPPAAGNTVVCRYAAGAETGVAAFSHTELPSRRVYEVRWIPDPHRRLRGVITTTNTTAQDWDSLQSNWTRLAGMH